MIVNNNCSKRKKTNKARKDNTILGYLKRIITWQSASFAAAIIIPISIYFCQKYDNAPKVLSEIELLKDSLKNDVSIIESSFNPDIIDIDKNTPHAFVKIKDFQLLSQELVTYWYMIEESPSILSFKEKKIDEVSEIIDHQLELSDYYVNTMGDIGDIMNSLDLEGRAFEVENYRLNIAMHEKSSILFKNYLNKLDTYQRKIGELKKNYVPRELSDSTAKNEPIYFEMINYANEMFSNIEYYRLSHSFFQWIIAQNKKYMLAYNYYKNDTKKKKNI